MSKFKNGLIKGQREEEAQKRNEENKEKIKKAVVKGTVSPLGLIIRKIATIILLVLATIGLLALIYPTTRAEMLNILREQWQQILSLLNL